MPSFPAVSAVWLAASRIRRIRGHCATRCAGTAGRNDIASIAAPLPRRYPAGVQFNPFCCCLQRGFLPVYLGSSSCCRAAPTVPRCAAGAGRRRNGPCRGACSTSVTRCSTDDSVIPFCASCCLMPAVPRCRCRGTGRVGRSAVYAVLRIPLLLQTNRALISLPVAQERCCSGLSRPGGFGRRCYLPARFLLHAGAVPVSGRIPLLYDGDCC